MYLSSSYDYVLIVHDNLSMHLLQHCANRNGRHVVAHERPMTDIPLQGSRTEKNTQAL